jgi:hypothetical protein
MNILESIPNLTLDPTSDNYIARIVGDKYRVWDSTSQRFTNYGTYPNNSKYIRVELDTNLSYVPALAIPLGFKMPPVPCWPTGLNIGMECDQLPTMALADVGSDKKKYYGLNFTKNFYDALNVSVSHSVTGSSSVAGILPCTSYSIYGLSSTSLTDASLIGFRKFTVPMYKGFDALYKTITTNYNNLYAGLERGFLDAVDIVGNTEEIDNKDLFVPGVSDSTVISEIITQVEDRKDIFAVVDSVQRTDTVSTQLTTADAYDSSYIGTYYPWAEIYDGVLQKSIWVPPSVLLAEVLAFNDKVADPWWAPAGMKRGTLPRVQRLAKNLTRNDLRDLDRHSVNPIRRISNEGFVVWGQKTLQKRKTALESINVRRLLVHAKKFVSFVAKGIVFELSVPDTWNSFVNQVTPFFDNIKNKRGLAEFKVVMDETTNTPDIIDRNIIKGQIYLQPRRAGEIIIVDFIIDKVNNSEVTFTG